MTRTTCWWVFTLGFVFFLFVPFGDFYSIVGDNICQVAYWRILFHRHLVGSIAPSIAKPGLMLLLGITHDVSRFLFGSTILIRLLLAAFAGLLVLVTTAMAWEGAGAVAAVFAAAYLLICTPAIEFFVQGSSMTFFLPLLFSGILLFAARRATLGAVLLCCASLIRIEGLAVLGWLSLSHQLFKRDIRGFVFSAVAAAATLALTVAVLYALTGDVHRLDVGGTSAGYFFGAVSEPSLFVRLQVALRFIRDGTLVVAFQRCGPPSLALPALIGVLFHRHRAAILAIIAIPVFLIAYVVFGGGSTQPRYLEFIIPIIAAFGVTGIYVLCALVLRPLQRFSRLQTAVSTARFIARPVLIGVSITAVVLTVARRPAVADVPATYAVYSRDAFAFLREQPIPRNANVLIDDDLGYGVMIADPDYFRRVTSLQYFNIRSQAEQERILRDTDYIWASKGRHGYYYLNYDPLRRGRADIFRQTLVEIVQSNAPKRVYGSLLQPIENTAERVVLRVEHEVRR